MTSLTILARTRQGRTGLTVRDIDLDHRTRLELIRQIIEEKYDATSNDEQDGDSAQTPHKN